MLAARVRDEDWADCVGVGRGGWERGLGTGDRVTSSQTSHSNLLPRLPAGEFREGEADIRRVAIMCGCGKRRPPRRHAEGDTEA
ncbi:hypothetical protein E2C01_040309 [Portunus trituberculatus]|uniref:Uncharacterized protein n=1 Tax=Portunus trituberculatus TaxID=210409 RepID=A0A5B7FM76_PORTR|nr:hypothetical protein [Portunus trituberculatus]